MLASSLAVTLALPGLVNAQQSDRPAVLIAEGADNDTPPELKGHLRGRVKPADDGGPAYGGRPFRRPHLNPDSATGENSPPTRGPDDMPGPVPAPVTGVRVPGGPGVGQDNGPPGSLPVRARRQFGNRPFGAPLVPGAGAPGEGPPPGRFGPPAAGRFRRGGEGPGGGGFFGRKPLDFSTLNLSDEQKQRIQQIHAANGPHAREFQQALKDRRSQMRDLMFDASSSDEQIHTKLRDVLQMQNKAEEAQVNDFLSIRKVLTPEQRQRLVDLKPGSRKVAIDQADGGPPPQQR